MFLVIPGLAACGAGRVRPRRLRYRSRGGGSGAPCSLETPAAAPAPAAPAPVRRRPARSRWWSSLGDSLAAGLGLDAAAAYPARVEQALEAAGEPVRVLNAGVSGDTTAGGLSRLGWILKQKPDVLVVGLGANDGLRGVPLSDVEKNLREILRRGQASGARCSCWG